MKILHVGEKKFFGGTIRRKSIRERIAGK